MLPLRDGYSLAADSLPNVIATPADGERMLSCPSSQRTRTRTGSSCKTSSITPRPARLRRPFRLNDDRVSDVSLHRASSVELITYREQASAPQIRTLLRALDDGTRPTGTTEAKNGTLTRA